MRVLRIIEFVFTTFLILLSLPVVIHSARICVFSVIGFMNHRSGYDTLLESLIDKGHEVTVFSTLPVRIGEQYKGKVRLVNPKAVVSHLDLFFSYISPLEWRKKGKQHVLWDMLPILALDICHIILQDKETQQWLRNEKRYDLFIVDSAWNECGIGLAHAFHAKLILFSFHSNLLSWNLDSFGAVGEVSWIPDPQYESTTPISFVQKIHFAIRTHRWYIYRNSFTLYQIQKFCRNFLQIKDFPSVRELEQNASLVVVNSHFSEEYARSLPPVFVSVGGVHIRTEESVGFKRSQQSAIVKKVESFVGASSGFILVNIGCSKDVVTNLSQQMLDTILNAMQKVSKIVKFVFIWDSSSANATQSNNKRILSKDNVLVVEECALELNTLLGKRRCIRHVIFEKHNAFKKYDIIYCDDEILFIFIAHPHIKGLISQGDMLDVQEAIYHAVPLILLPVVFEQDANAERIERLGRGIRLEIISLKEDHFIDAVHNLITNSTYKNNMRAASLTFRDRQVKPLDSAVWWIEYSLRNSDTSSLKPLGINQTWYSRRLLDVWLLFFASVVAASVAIILVLSAMLFKSFLCKILLCRYCGGQGEKIKTP